MPENQFYKDDFENDEGTILKTVRFEQRDFSPPVNIKSSLNDIPKQTS